MAQDLNPLPQLSIYIHYISAQLERFFYRVHEVLK